MHVVIWIDGETDRQQYDAYSRFYCVTVGLRSFKNESLFSKYVSDFV